MYVMCGGLTERRVRNVIVGRFGRAGGCFFPFVAVSLYWLFLSCVFPSFLVAVRLSILHAHAVSHRFVLIHLSSALHVCCQEISMMVYDFALTLLSALFFSRCKGILFCVPDGRIMLSTA